MPDDKKELESGGFEQLLLDLVDKAAGKTEGSKGSSLPVYLIITGLVVICFAIVGFVAVRSKRRAAQLEYELRKKQEEQKRAAEQVKLDADATKRAEAEKSVASLETYIQGLKEELKATEDASVARTKALAAATSWDDLVIVDRRK